MTTDIETEDIGVVEPYPTKPGTSPWVFGALVAAIVLISGLLYIPSLHGGMVWDDAFLLKGTGLSHSTTVWQCFTRAFLFNYYRPLTGASFILEHRLWGLNTFGYHITNVLLHVLTTAVMIPLLLIAFRSRRIALCGAALFAVQPLQVSTVAWIGGRTDSLCTFFIALFWLVLVMGARSTGVRRNILLALSFVLYASAAAAKEQALILAPMVPLALYIFRTRYSDKSADSYPKSGDQSISTQAKSGLMEMGLWTIPFVLLAPCQLLAWKKYGDPVYPHWNLGFQIPAIGRTIDYYVMLLLTPSERLLHTWTLGEISKSGLIGVLIGYIIAAAAVLAFVRWMRSEPTLAWFFAGTALLLLPVSNAFPLVTQVVAPYRAGTAGFGAAAVIGWAIVKLWDRVRAESTAGSRQLLIAAPVLIYLTWLGYLTNKDTYIWRTQMSASLAVEHYDPTSTFGTLEVAASYLDAGNTGPAIERLDRLMETVRDHRFSVVRSDSALWWMYGGYPADWIGELYGRAGNWKLEQGDRAGALLLLNKGDMLAPSNEIVRVGLANWSFKIHDNEGGIKQLRILLKYRPKLIDDRMVLAEVLWRTNRWSEADIEITKCLQRRPYVRDLYLKSAYARIQMNDRSGAAEVLSVGVQNGTLEPDKLQEWLASINEPELMNLSTH